MADPVETPTVGLDLEGERIPLEGFLAATEALLAILKDVDARVMDRAGGSLTWIVSGLQGGSAHLQFSPSPRDEKTPVWAAGTVIRTFREGMSRIVSHAERPSCFSSASLRRVQSLVALTGESGIRSIDITVGGDSISLSPAVARNVREVVEGSFQAIGSVEGTLETISVHGQPYFNIYDRITGKPVRCQVPDDLIDAARDAFGKRVLVRGRIQSRPSGEIASVRVRSIETFPAAADLPTVDMMRGILKNG